MKKKKKKKEKQNTNQYYLTTEIKELGVFLHQLPNVILGGDNFLFFLDCHVYTGRTSFCDVRKFAQTEKNRWERKLTRSQ